MYENEYKNELLSRLDFVFLEDRYFKTCEQSMVSKEDEKWGAFLNVIGKSN